MTDSGWSETSSASNMNSPSGSRPQRCSTSASTPVPLRAEIGKMSSETSSSDGRLQHRDDVRVVDAVDLVDRDDDRHVGALERARDEAVARARRPARR